MAQSFGLALGAYFETTTVGLVGSMTRMLKQLQSPPHCLGEFLSIRLCIARLIPGVPRANRKLSRARSPVLRCVAVEVVCLVSLVSVWGRNWRYICGTIEKVEAVEIVEFASIHAVFMQVTQNMIRQQIGRGEYQHMVPTIMSGLHYFRIFHRLGLALSGKPDAPICWKHC